MKIKKVGIIGAGQMGSGIAHVCALAGYDVSLFDIAQERIEAALATINGNLARQVNSQKITQKQRDNALSLIKPIAKMADFSDCDIVIEAATEDETVKRAIMQELCPLLPPHTLIGTNTSSISVTRLAAATSRPEKFMGVHFMNPVPVMELVELIRGIATEDDTFQTFRTFVKSLDKSVTISEDFPAFIVNRILLPMINEAIYVLYEGVGSVKGIDKAMHLGANHRMGPLQLADFIGCSMKVSATVNTAPARYW